MKSIFILTVCFLFCVSNVYCQEFNVPENVHLAVAADYSQYEQDIISAAKWLNVSPLDEQIEKRRKVSAFVLAWVNGSPTVKVEINPTIMDFEKRNEGMLILYMANCARYVLENNYSRDMRAKHRFALREMIKVYKSGQGIKKDKKMEKLVKSDEEGNIDKWLASNLKINQD